MAEDEISTSPSDEQESGGSLLLQEAIEALRDGTRARARDSLTRLLKANPQDALAWLWLSAAVETGKERLYCLQMAQKFDPENEAVRRGLVLMGAMPADDSIPPFPLHKREWEETLKPVEEHKPRGLKAAWSNPLARAFMLLALGVLMAGLLTFGVLYRRSMSPLPARPIGPHPSVTASATPMEEESIPIVLPTILGPTPLWMFLPATYTPTAAYVNTPHTGIGRDAFRGALRSFQKGDYAVAKVQFEQMLTYEPEAADAYYYIGECNLALRDYRAAREAFRKAVNLNPNFAAGYLGQARAARLLDPQAEVRSLLDTAISLDPQYQAAFVERALYYLGQNRYHDALADLESAIALNPNDPLAYLYLSQAQLQLGKTDEALLSAQKAHELDLTLLPAYLTLGQVYYTSKRWTEALAVLNIYIQYLPNDEETLMLLGATYSETGEYRTAIRYLDRTLSLNNKNGQAYAYRGYAYLMLEEPKQAIADLKRALDFRPLDFQIHIWLARAHIVDGRPGNAYKELSNSTTIRLARTNAQKAELYYWTAISLEQIGDQTAKLGAKAQWRNLLSLPPSDVPEEWRAKAEKYLYGGSPTPSATPTATRTPRR